VSRVVFDRINHLRAADHGARRSSQGAWHQGIKLVVSRSKKGGVSALTSLAAAIRKKKPPAAAAVAVAVTGNVPSGTQASTDKSTETESGSASSKEAPTPTAPAACT
jgi:hypothetical protein